MITSLVVMVLWAAGPVPAQTMERFRAVEEARRSHLRAIGLWNSGKHQEAVNGFLATLKERERLYPPATHPDGHAEVAMTLAWIGYTAQQLQRLAVAELYSRRALEMYEKLYPKTRYPDGHPDLAASLNSLALLHKSQGEYAKAEPLYRRALLMCERLYPEARHPDLARSLSNLAALHHAQGEYARAEPLYRRALEMRERLYPKARYPGGHPHLAASLNSLAALHTSQGEYAKAEPLFRRALQMYERLYPDARHPDGHPHLAASLSHLAGLYRAQGEYAKAEPLLRRALLMCERLYPDARHPDGQPDLAASLNNLATLHHSQGEYARAEPLLRRALEMDERLYPEARYPDGHPDLAARLNNLALLHREQGEYARAEPLYRRALLMVEKLYPKTRYPDGHPDLAASLNNLAALHQDQGEYARAEPLFRRALQMREKLYPKTRYPDGHPHLAHSLNNLALLHQNQGEYARAEPLLRRALLMCERLYPDARHPDGHPDLARSLSNLAALLHAQREYAKAEPLYRRALEMREGLYPKARNPDGHPDLALCLNSLAALLHAQGQYARAEPLLRRALEMNEKLYPKSRYPDGHPHLASSLNNLAVLHLAQGEYARAEPLARRALEMYTASATASAVGDEGTALNLLARQPLALHAYLSVTADPPSADSYGGVWQAKGVLAWVAQRRHLDALASGSAEARTRWDALAALRHQRERLLLAPAGGDAAKDRDRKLDELDETIRQHRERLQTLLPELKRAEELARLTPEALRKALPPNTVVVDLVRYTRFGQNPKVKGIKGETRTDWYAAFVVTRDGVKRVELKEAKDVEEALGLWRRAILEGSPAEVKYATELHRLVWSPLKGHLPPKTSVVYVCPDAALSRLPWAALRDGKTDRILIEDHAVAAVPHGPFLLDLLTRGKRKDEGKLTLLAMGGVAYDDKPATVTEVAARSPAADALTWKALAGAARELDQVAALADSRPVGRLEGKRASAAALLAELPKADTAHLATHGFFADEKFRSVLHLDPKLFAGRRFITGETAQRFGALARTPLVLSGVVCAGANLPDTPGRGIVTAESIVGLDLRRMNLAVLSACETGLGETAGNQGVFSLTTAFHVAGCRNVAASLWKVDDEATAALMVLFYRHLWDKANPVGPAEAMRRAQLAVYRNPSLIKEWAAGRGPIPKPVPGSATTPEKAPAGKTSPARAWAAFVVSGPGD